MPQKKLFCFQCATYNPFTQLCDQLFCPHRNEKIFDESGLEIGATGPRKILQLKGHDILTLVAEENSDCDPYNNTGKNL